MMLLGKCPFCKDGQIEIRKKEVNNKKVELYACSNLHWKTEDGELFELTEDSTCSFRIWQNALSRYGHWLNHKEVRGLLNNEEVKVSFKTMKRLGQKERKSYEKFIVLDEEYGVKILFDMEC